jgi:hypothetical protein
MDTSEPRVKLPRTESGVVSATIAGTRHMVSRTDQTPVLRTVYRVGVAAGRVYVWTALLSSATSRSIQMLSADSSTSAPRVRAHVSKVGGNTTRTISQPTPRSPKECVLRL